MLLISSCHHTDVTIAWDKPNKYKDGKPIPQEYNIRYNVYLKVGNHEPQCLTDKHRIKKTTYTIDHAKVHGPYIVGVDAAIFLKETQVGPPSDKAWSSIEKYTNGNPFDIDIIR